MTIKNRTVAALNSLAVLCCYSWFPIVDVCAPRESVFYMHTCLVALNLLVMAVDFLNSDNTQKNYKIAKAAGYSDGYLFFCAFFAFIILSYMTLYDITALPHYTNELWIPSREEFSLNLILTAAFLVAVSDWFFYVFHRLLHEYLPKVHLLHHCCVYSSLTTNAFFEPLDVMLEFAAPVLFMRLVALKLLDSSWALILGQAVLTTYYTLTHDEYLCFQHAKHHRGCATGYFIYNDYFYSDPKKEKVRTLIPGFSRLNGKEQ